MQRLIFLVIFLTSLVQTVDGGMEAVNGGLERVYGGIETEFRVGYFYPTSQRFRSIYHNTRVDYQIEASVNFTSKLDLWGNVSWLPTTGNSIGEHHHTRLNLVPLSGGLKYCFYYRDCFRLRLGAGVAWYNLWTRDDTCCCCVKKHNHHNAVGGAFKSDITYYFCNCNYVDFFVDYLYLPLRRCREVGGVITGVGIGHSF